MVRDLWFLLIDSSRGAWQTVHECHAHLKFLNEMLPEIHTLEKFYFLKTIIHSQMIKFSVKIHVIRKPVSTHFILETPKGV